MKRRVLLTLLMLVLPLAAQEARKVALPAPPPPKGDIVSKVFEVKHQDPERLAGMLGSFGAQLRPSSPLKAIAVSGPLAIVDAVGEAIKRFDIPAKNTELIAYLVAASQQAGQADTVPKELDPVIKQLKGLFTYQGYRLLDTMVARTREGQNLQMSGIAPGLDSSPAQAARPTVYQLTARSVNLTADPKGNLIRLDGLRFSAKVLSGGSYFDTGINTDLDVREGQKVVVGKTGMGSSGDALILVVTAKVVD